MDAIEKVYANGVEGQANLVNGLLNKLIFPAPPPSYTWESFPGELLCLVGNEGNIVPSLFLPWDSAGEDGNQPAEVQESDGVILLIYCHANGEDIGSVYEAGMWLNTNLGVHVLIPEYPGYGQAPGQASEESVMANVQAAYDFAIHGLKWNPYAVVFLGRSIGTGPAVALAAKHRCGGLVLISPYTSIKDVVRNLAGPFAMLAENSDFFPSELRICNVECPTLIVHGMADRVIACDHAHRLHKACKSEDCTLVVLDGVGHRGVELYFAVAKYFIHLEGACTLLTLDQFLVGTAYQGDTIASPVPAFDCSRRAWTRPTLDRGQPPFLRNSPTGTPLPQPAPAADSWSVGRLFSWTDARNSLSGLSGLSGLGGGDGAEEAELHRLRQGRESVTVTDESMLDRMVRELVVKQSSPSVAGWLTLDHAAAVAAGAGPGGPGRPPAAHHKVVPSPASTPARRVLLL